MCVCIFLFFFLQTALLPGRESSCCLLLQCIIFRWASRVFTVFYVSVFFSSYFYIPLCLLILSFLSLFFSFQSFSLFLSFIYRYYCFDCLLPFLILLIFSFFFVPSLTNPYSFSSIPPYLLHPKILNTISFEVIAFVISDLSTLHSFVYSLTWL